MTKANNVYSHKTALNLVNRAVGLLGIAWFFREVVARRKVTVINYHNPCPDLFLRHAEFLARRYSFVSIGQVVDALRSGDLGVLPPKPLLVTFDDGYEGNSSLFPVFARYRIPAVIYMVAGVVGTRRRFWFDQLPHDSKEMTFLCGLPDDKRREWLRREKNHWDEREYSSPVALTVAQVREFSHSGGTIGSHTMFHPLLGRCDEKIGYDECLSSRRVLEEIVGSAVTHFALPRGDFSPKVLDWVRRAGYISCRTIEAGWVTEKSNPLALPTIGIPDDAPIMTLAARVSGFSDLIKKLFSG